MLISPSKPFGSLFGNTLENKQTSNKALDNFNNALAKGDKQGLMDAAAGLKSGESISKSFQANFMQASFEQSGGNFSFQLSALSISGMSSAFNTGDALGTYSRTSLSSQTLTISGSMSALNSLGGFEGLNDILKSKGIDLAQIGYEGKAINELSQSEANALISENGFFGINNTANRVADFVIKGAGDDLELLKAGLKGVKQGYEEAQKLWRDTLPEISQKTQELTLKLIEERIKELGGDTSGNAVNLEA